MEVLFWNMNPEYMEIRDREKVDYGTEICGQDEMRNGGAWDNSE